MQLARQIWQQWQIPFAVLLGYWIVAALAVRFVHVRWCSKRRATNPRRYRFFFALTIAVVFTPSVIGDFFLFILPGPAVIGLLLFLRAGLHEPVYLLVALIYYVLPMALVFAMTYAVLLRRDCHTYAAPTA